jgi:hypothetical protein
VAPHQRPSRRIRSERPSPRRGEGAKPGCGLPSPSQGAGSGVRVDAAPVSEEHVGYAAHVRGDTPVGQ